jgi:GGDEF domain-containing protein
MQIFDQIDPLALDRRETQLWVLAIALITIMAAGTALFMYPAVFSRPIVLSGPAMSRLFFGFCILSVLTVGYLVDRQLVIRSLRSQLIEEQRRNAALRHQASADLLETLPGLSHFQDRLAMEFRRSARTRLPLSVLTVSLTPSRDLVDAAEVSTAFGDAAKAIIRKLRREDSVFLLHPGFLGVILPETSGTNANRVADRIAEGLHDAGGASNRYRSTIRVFNYPEHTSSEREMEGMVRSASEDKAGALAAAGADAPGQALSGA